MRGQHVVGGEVGGRGWAPSALTAPGLATAASRPRPAGMSRSNVSGAGIAGGQHGRLRTGRAGGIRLGSRPPRADRQGSRQSQRASEPSGDGALRSDADVRSAAKRSARHRQVGHGGTSTAGPLGLIGPSGCSGDAGGAGVGCNDAAPMARNSPTGRPARVAVRSESPTRAAAASRDRRQPGGCAPGSAELPAGADARLPWPADRSGSPGRRPWPVTPPSECVDSTNSTSRQRMSMSG